MVVMAFGSRGNMPAPPEQHSNWIELLFGGGVLGAVITRGIDAARTAWASMRRSDSAVKVAGIQAETSHDGQLWAEINSLRNDAKANTVRLLEQADRAAEQERRIGALEASNLRDRIDFNARLDRIDGVVKKIEAIVSPDAVGGTVPELIATFRTLTAELREALGHDPYPRSTIIGDSERTLGSGGQ